MISIAETLVPHYAVWPLLLLLLGTLGTVLKRNYSVSGTVRTKKNELKKYEHPDTLPFLGNLFILAAQRSKVLDWFLSQDRIFETPYIVRFPLVAKIVIANNANDLEYVMKNIDLYRKGRPYTDLLHEALGRGFLVADGETWKVQRKAGLIMFTQKNLQNSLEKCLEKQMEYIKSFLKASEGTVLDLQEVFTDFTTRFWLQAAYGDEVVDDTDFARDFDIFMRCIDDRFRNPIWQLKEFIFGSPLRKAVKSFMPKVRHLAAVGKTEFLMALRQNMPEDLVVDASLNYLLAARDTSARTMTWMFEALMQHPDILSKLRSEIAREGQPLSIQRLQSGSMPYTYGVVWETLRLYPGLPLNMRECQRNTVLPSGVPMEPKMWVVWSPWVMGRSTKIWGPTAEEFQPERWLTGSSHKSAYEMPVFHGGPRSCLGQNLAVLQLAYVVTELAQGFDFEKVRSGPTLQANSILLEMEGGLPSRVSARSRFCV